MKLKAKVRFYRSMVISYVRPDKNFIGVYEQIKEIKAYAESRGFSVDREFVDHTSQNKRLDERGEVVLAFRALKKEILVVYDVWVLSSHIEDVVQMFSCLLKNEMEVHFVKPAVIIDRYSDVMLVLGLIDQLRQVLYETTKKAIGRPRGSRSSSKFDKFQDVIIQRLREHQSVSQMARELNVSRSSLKDYIESRELKEVALGGSHFQASEDAEAKVIMTIKCPLTKEETIQESI